MANLSFNALKILKDRYLIKDASGKVKETPEGLFRRVAKSISMAELTWGTKKEWIKWEELFFNLMFNLDFLPNSTTLMNAGTHSGQLSSCFVLPVKDSLISIYDTLKLSALVQQKGGGTGFNFSDLRPKGDRIGTHGGSSSGAVSFIELYNFSTGHIKQGGKRLGANMGILNVDHPDIFEFLRLGSRENHLHHFNLSVGITDPFMQKLQDGGVWKLINPRTGKPVNHVLALDLWKEIVKNACKSGNPGLIFLDTIQNTNPIPGLGKIQSTNPCGEVPLLPYESCNLGSINLSRFLKKDQNRILPDWERLGKAVAVAIRFLDDVIEVNNFPNSKIRATTLHTRKIGLGVMGWAEFLLQLEIPYASKQAVDLAEKLMAIIQEKSVEATRELAEVRGVFPAWKESVFFPHEPRRNATVNSIAPTGTISVLADTTNSIEPFFALAFERRNVLEKEILDSVNPKVLEYLQDKGLLSEKVIREIHDKGSCALCDELDNKTKLLLRTAVEIEPYWHLKHQAAFQKFTDNAVSKTINLPSSVSEEEVDEIFRKAWTMGLKGITVFRTGSGRQQLMYPGLTSNPKEDHALKD
jgi:ribonucleoside-diphosphate reductase alpha chain